MNTDVLFPYDGATYSENYVLYTKSGQDGCFWFFDVVTKSAGPYCFDPSCEHKRAVYDMNGNKIEEGCLAYEIDRTPFPCGEYLYYYQEYPLRLYRTNRQGNNRELIAEPDGPYETYFGYIIRMRLYILGIRLSMNTRRWKPTADRKSGVPENFGTSVKRAFFGFRTMERLR